MVGEPSFSYEDGMMMKQHIMVIFFRSYCFFKKKEATWQIIASTEEDEDETLMHIQQCGIYRHVLILNLQQSDCYKYTYVYACICG